MGIVQLNQLQAQVVDKYEGKIQVDDAQDPDMALRTRGLAAWVVEKLSGAGEEEAAVSVVDGYGDNGLDAVHFDATNGVVYLVQSKWSTAGTGSTAVGDVHKFVQGFRDLVNLEFDRFNAKLRTKQADLEAALNDPNIQFRLVLAHTGTSSLSPEARLVLDGLLEDVNDPIETASFESLTQAELHAFLRRGVKGAQPDLRVVLHDWGHTQEPYAAYYGQVDAASIAEWYASYRHTLFDRNLREFLGRSSEVNLSLLETLREAPTHFWYFNNGVTVLCESVSKAAAGGLMKKSGTFDFQGVSIVNGAQTVGCIGEAALEDPALVADARVMVRFISLEDCPPGFSSEVTRGTNTQNRVERRDFVALDPEQGRLREEMAIDGVTYAIKSGEASPGRESGCSIVEATIALACAQAEPEMAVQAKREIGRLWVGAESASGASLYRTLFNRRTNGQQVWRAVRALRMVDAALSSEQGRRAGRAKQIGVHGNRLIAHLVLQEDARHLTSGTEEDFKASLTDVATEVHAKYDALVAEIQVNYSSNYLASLFKNASRCAALVAELS